MKTPRFRFLLLGSAAFAVSLGSAAATITSCSGAKRPTASQGDQQGSKISPLQSFQPRGCDFSITPRPEYLGFSLGTNVVGKAPKIERVRLGLGGNVAPDSIGKADPSTSIAVAWQSDEETLTSELVWGKTPDPSSFPAENRTTGITFRIPETGINSKGAERIHEAYLCGLEPSTTYYYRVGGGAGATGAQIWSDVYSFTTLPNDPSATVKIGVTGDSRGENGDAWRLLQRRMKRAGVAMMLFSGDMVAKPSDQGALEHWLDSAWRDKSGESLTLPSIVMLVAHGNHENHTNLFFGNVVLPQDFTQKPYKKYAELFYSVDVGPVHVVVFDDAWIGSPDQDPDYKDVFTPWLEADLKAAVQNRVKVPWIVAVHHHGEFSSSRHGKDADVLRNRAYFVPIWDKYHVDLVVAGHDHNYERTKPLTGPAAEPTLHTSPKDGTVYVVCAGAGAPAYAPGKSSFTEVSHGYGDPQSGALGVYGVLTAGPSSLKLEAYELRKDASDPLFDTLIIPRP